ncbi:MAG: MgtC/SapB family protein [Clostridia bacterium]
MPNMTELEYILRLVIAAVCGVMIGYERQNRSKVAGVRTHCVVACASALMMILSKYAYLDVVGIYGELMKVDPSRVASGVVSGIGFLGAGMIFVNKKTVTGLTTAAGVWATSGIGMVIGAGLYWIGGAATLIILLIQIVLHITPKLHIQHNYRLHRKCTDNLPVIKQAELINIYPTEETDEDGRVIYKATIAFSHEQEELWQEDIKS